MNVVKCDMCGAIVKPVKANSIDIRWYNNNNLISRNDLCPSCKDELENKFKKENDDV